MPAQCRPACFLNGLTAGLACALLSTGAHAENRLTITASTPQVTIETRAAGRNFINLPSLQFDFVLETVCDDSMTPAAVMLSVADTTHALNAEQIGIDQPTAVSLRIPAGQIGPVALNTFCAIAENDPTNGALQGEISGAESGTPAVEASSEQGSDGSATTSAKRVFPDTLLIPSVLSAQASLLCRGEQVQQAVYASRALDVVLTCRQPEEAGAVPAE